MQIACPLLILSFGSYWLQRRERSSGWLMRRIGYGKTHRKSRRAGAPPPPASPGSSRATSARSSTPSTSARSSSTAWAGPARSPGARRASATTRRCPGGWATSTRASSARRSFAHLLFWDESGFFLTPTVRRALAPRGKTPVLLAWDRRDKLSAISCISVSPKAGRPGLHFELLGHNAKAEDVVAFLEQMRRQLRGGLTVIWDGNQIHSKARAVKEYLAAHPEVVAETFPGYVPDLNPDEGVWGWTKYGRLANLAARDTTELWEQVGGELWELKHQPDLLKGFIRETGLIGLLRAG
jgi:transposase